MESLSQDNHKINSGYILITGVAGFIASHLIQHLNEWGIQNLIIVDDFGDEAKRKNWENKSFAQKVERYFLFDWLEREKPVLNCVVHLGARTDMNEQNFEVCRELNYNYTIHLWKYCVANKIPFIYTTVAAVYEDKIDTSDNHELLSEFQPTIPYLLSKHEFDCWATRQKYQPPIWAGLRLFEVYGKGEEHKGINASIVHHFKQTTIPSVDSIQPNSAKKHDLIHVKDVVAIIDWMMQQMIVGAWQPNTNGIFNVGTGSAYSKDDVQSLFNNMSNPTHPNIIQIESNKGANIKKLRNAGFIATFSTLQEGIEDLLK